MPQSSQHNGSDYSFLVVVSCTHRKKLRPVVKARSLQETELRSRFREWTSSLDSSDVNPVVVRDFYSGDHWAVSLNLESVDTSILACSAGYGLVSTDDEITPYAATFGTTHEDYVCPGYPSSEWWEELSQWRPNGANLNTPRSLSETLESVGDNGLLIVALPSTYLSAVRSDLSHAARSGSRGHLAVISAGTRMGPDLESILLPVDARLQCIVGGPRQSLNARAAGFVIDHIRTVGGFDFRDVSRFLQATLANQEMPNYDRKQLTDVEVRRFIKNRLRFTGNTSKTTLLRSLRNSGFACEQKRFSNLFEIERTATDE